MIILKAKVVEKFES